MVATYGGAPGVPDGVSGSPRSEKCWSRVKRFIGERVNLHQAKQKRDLSIV